MSVAADSGQKLYGRWEKPRSTGLFGLTWGVTILAGVLLIGIIISFIFTRSFVLAGGLIFMSILVVAPLAWSINGRTGWEMIVLRFQFQMSRLLGETRSRGGIFGVVGGRGRLTGILASSSLYEYELRSGDRFGVIHWRADNKFSVVLGVQPQGQERVDQWQIDSWVAGWGDFLARLGADMNVVGAEVTIETFPDFGQSIDAEVRRLTKPHAPKFARAVMAATVTERRSARVRADTRIALTFQRIREADSKNVDDQVKAIGMRLSTIIAAGHGAGLAPTPLTAGELCAVVTRANNPELTADLEVLASNDGLHQLDWGSAGSVTGDNTWSCFRHNGFKSVSWEMSAAPAGQVPSDTLVPLLAPRVDLPRKRVTIVYRTHSTAEAVKMVDTDLREALAAEQSKNGIASAHASLRVANTKTARAEQALGAGLTRFGMIITCTAPADADLAQIRTELKGLGEAARIGVRLCHGYHSAAFAGGLGIGVMLPEHASANAKITE